MDEYSVRTKAWLDSHFQRVDSDGIYVAHQSIYGFRVGHCETLLSVNYIRTFHIMRALSSCDIGSLLDVGAAEGHKAFLAKTVLGVPHVECCDLSSEAAKRAGEIFKLQARQADIHALPYDDLQFDAVLCCETLEHVADVKRATAELVRVTKKIIVIAVPNESPEDVNAERESGLMHGHINAFDAGSFDYLKAEGWVIYHKKILSRSLYRLRVLADADEMVFNNKGFMKRSMFVVYNWSRPLLRWIFNRYMMAFTVWLDTIVCRISQRYFGHIFVLVRQEFAGDLRKSGKVGILDVLNVSVPLHRLK